MVYIQRLSCIVLLLLLWIYIGDCKTFSLVYSLKEHSEIGFIIGDVRLSDRIMEESATDLPRLTFKMLDHNEFVAVDNGKLVVKADIDREKVCTKSRGCCCLDLMVLVSRPQGPSDYLEVRVLIEDVNDHAPSWTQAAIGLHIPEHTKVGTKYRLPAAVDPDSQPKNSVTKYRLEYQSEEAKTLVSLVHNPESTERSLSQLWLKVDKDIDRERIEGFELRLVAEDSGLAPMSGSVLLTVTITDVNDNQPFFDKTVHEASIKENNRPNAFLHQMTARDKDVSDLDRLRYSFGFSLSQEEALDFQIDERTGKVTVRRSLDYETDQTTFYLPVQVTDGANVAETTLAVRLLNENDNPPTITTLPHVRTVDNVFMVEENSEADLTLATVTTMDPDNATATIVCLSASEGVRLQGIEARTASLTKYALILTRPLDREVDQSLMVTVVCHDDGDPPLTASSLLKVQVLDQNDCAPRFATATATVTLDENLPNGTFVMRVVATDNDTGINARLLYEIDRGVTDRFSIDPKTGVITTRTALDRERGATCQVTVAVYDRGREAGARPQDKVLSATATVTVVVRDLNDCAPVIPRTSYEFAVLEESLPRMFVGAVSAEDADIDPENRQVTFSMGRGSSGSHFRVSPDGGIHTTSKVLDRELLPMASFIVEARDGPHSKHLATVEVVVRITDVNDNHPMWVFPTTSDLHLNISQEEPIGRLVTVLKATDADIKENAELHFDITQGNDLGLFRLDRKSGSLYLVKSPPRKGPDIIRLGVKVSDNGKIPLSNTTTLRVRILRDSSWLTFEHRHLDKDLVVMICMISVTLIVSGILVFAIVLLKCKHCFKKDIPDPPGNKDNRPGNPDGRSSPTVSELDNSPQRMSSDFSMYHNRLCQPRGFIYEGFQPLPKPDAIPLYYTLKPRTSISEHASDQSDYYHEKCSPLSVPFSSPFHPVAQVSDYRAFASHLHGGADPQYLKYLPGVTTLMPMATDPMDLYSSSGLMYSNVDVLSNPMGQQRKLLPSVKWSDLIQEKSVYDANSNSCQLSKEQITSFV